MLYNCARILVVSYRNSTSNHNLFTVNCQRFSVVSYRNSTSNHNIQVGCLYEDMLYLIEILHQTTTISTRLRTSKWLYLIEILHQTTTLSYTKQLSACCILSKFYIKPQLPALHSCRYAVVSYRNSTSNHNSWSGIYKNVSLYLIEILHQTTTSGLILIDKVLLTGCLPL